MRYAEQGGNGKDAVVPETEFGRHLKALRQTRELTQKELAKAAGCDTMTISRWERGVVMPEEASRSVVIKAAQALGESPLRLLQLAALEDRDDLRTVRRRPPLRELILSDPEYTPAQKRALLAALEVIEGRVE